MAFWDYERIRVTQWQWDDIQKAKPALAKDTPTYNQPLTPGEGGPQFYADADADDEE